MEQLAKEVVVDVKPPLTEEIDIGADSPVSLPVNAKEKEEEFPVNSADDGIEQLKRELEAKKREAEEIRRQKFEAEQNLYKKDEEVRNYAYQAADNQYTAFVNAIASYERDGEMLENEYASKLEQGDYHSAAKIQRQMAQIESKLSTLHQGKDALAERIEYERARPEPRMQQPTYEQTQYDPVEAELQRLSGPSQAWVRKNIHIMQDQKSKNLLAAAHYRAIADNLQPDSPQYFQYLENEMGLGEKPAPQSTKQRNVMAAAPVARGGSVPTMNNNQVRVTLTPEMRAYAEEVLGMSDEEYAEAMLYYNKKGKLQL
jgi:hypothetical protein